MLKFSMAEFIEIRTFDGTFPFRKDFIRHVPYFRNISQDYKDEKVIDLSEQYLHFIDFRQEAVVDRKISRREIEALNSFIATHMNELGEMVYATPHSSYHDKTKTFGVMIQLNPEDARFFSTLSIDEIFQAGVLADFLTYEEMKLSIEQRIAQLINAGNREAIKYFLIWARFQFLLDGRSEEEIRKRLENFEPSVKAHIMKKWFNLDVF
jgi:hypothetical protein